MVTMGENMSACAYDEARGQRRAMTAAAGVLAGTMLGVSFIGMQQAFAAEAASAVAGDQAQDAVESVSEEASASAYVEVENVQGDFAYSQDVVTPTDEIARAMYGADAVLCSGGEAQSVAAEDVVEDASQWEITVTGDGVSSSFTATLGDLAEAGTQTKILGCTCVGNPADGRATVNAQCTGVSVFSILELAGLSDDANVITFTSSDGYEVSLPLSYVLQHASMIVYQINDEPISESMGGTNQLWLGSTAARYFSRDTVQITVSCVDDEDVPPAPGTKEAGDMYENRPNVGVLSGASA